MKNELKHFKKKNIYYSSDFFEERTLELITDLKLSDTILNYFHESESDLEKKIEEVYPSVWKELEDSDKEIKKIVQTHEINIALEEKKFETAILDDVNNQLEGENREAMNYEHEVTRTEEGFIHKYNGEIILKIPFDSITAEEDNKKVEFFISCGETLLDAIIIVCTAIGVRVAKSKKAISRSIAAVGQNSANLAKLNSIDKKATAISQFITFFRIFQGDTGNIRKIITCLFDDMNFFEKVIAIANFIASLLLLGFSGGASLAFKIASLSMAIVMFLTDLYQTIDKYKKWKGEEPGEGEQLNWSRDNKVENILMSSSPSAIGYNNKIYCFHQGSGNSGELWYKVFDGNSWSEDNKVENTLMSGSPSAIVYNNKIYCFHQGSGNSEELWFNIFDGNSWSGDNKVENTLMSGSPSVIVYNNKIYCFHQGSGNSEELWFNIFDGNSWLGDNKVENTLMSVSPSVIVYNNKIYCFHQGSGNSEELWFNIFDGNSWSGDNKVENTLMSGSPSAIVYNNMIYCFHQGSGNSEELWFNIFDGNSWLGDNKVENTLMSDSPSAIVYNNKIYCFHQGSGMSGELWFNSNC